MKLQRFLFKFSNGMMYLPVLICGVILAVNSSITFGLVDCKIHMIYYGIRVHYSPVVVRPTNE